MINDSHWEDSVQLQKVKTFRQRCTRLLDGVTTSSTRSISWWGRMPGCRRNTCNSSRAQIRNGRVRESFINNNRWSWRGWTWWHSRKIPGFPSHTKTGQSYSAIILTVWFQADYTLDHKGLWFQADHNLDIYGPVYDQPGTINLYGPEYGQPGAIKRKLG